MRKSLLMISLLFLHTLILFAQKDEGIRMLMRNPSHTGVYQNADVNHFEKVKWKFKTDGKIYSSPVIDKGRVYIGSEDKNLYSIDVKTGREIWHFATGGAVHSTPTVYKDVVYFLSFDGNFYAVDVKTGLEKWRFATEGEKWVGGYHLWHYETPELYKEDLWQYFLSSAVIEDSQSSIYFGSSDSHLYALDLKTGKLKWKFKTGAEIHTSPALDNGVLFFGSWDRKFYAVDSKTGAQKWSLETRDDQDWGGMKGIVGSPTVYQNKVFFGSRDGYLYALNEQTGDKIWEYWANGTWVMNTPAVKDGIIYFGTSDSDLFIGLDVNSKEEIFKFKTDGYVYSSPAIAGKTAYFGTFSGKIIALDLDSKGRRWEEFQTEASKKYSDSILTAEGNLDYDKIFANYEFTNYYEADKHFLSKLYLLGPIVSSPAIVENVAYFGSADGYLYAVDLSKNRSPKVVITSPWKNQQFLTGSDVSIRAAVRDHDGISKVEYFANNQKLTSISATSFVWKNVPAGKYTLQVKAIDRKGGRALSDTLSIYVKDSIDSSAIFCNYSGKSIPAYAYPNPFSDQTKIHFVLEVAGNTTVVLYNKEGKVAQVFNGYLESGDHNVEIPFFPLKQDIYYCKIQSGKYQKVLRLMKR